MTQPAPAAPEAIELKPCVKCKWSRSCMAGRYCVNPAMKDNITTLAVYGSLEGRGMNPCIGGNECGYLRNTECGLNGKYWEPLA